MFVRQKISYLLYSRDCSRQIKNLHILLGYIISPILHSEEKPHLFQMLYMDKCVTWPKASLRQNFKKQGYPNFDYLRKKN